MRSTLWQKMNILRTRLVLIILGTTLAATTVQAVMDVPGVPREPHPTDAKNALITVLIAAAWTLIGSVAITWISFWGLRKFRESNRS